MSVGIGYHAVISPDFKTVLMKHPVECFCYQNIFGFLLLFHLSGICKTLLPILVYLLDPGGKDQFPIYTARIKCVWSRNKFQPLQVCLKLKSSNRIFYSFCKEKIVRMGKEWMHHF
jgi:hypothetical protein